MNDNHTNIHYRSGIVSIVGKTNVGKSTFLNTILEEKVSIVSDRVQTTRNIIRAIFTSEKGQLVFMDTPGIHKANGDLGKNMNKMARSSIEGVDIILLVLDASEPPEQIDEGWFRRLSKSNIPCFFVLNKIDKKINYEINYKKLWDEINCEKSGILKPYWINISALRNIRIKQIIEKLISDVPIGPKLFPDDVLTDYPRKLNIADVLREKLFNRLHQELPHAIAVWIENIQDFDEKCLVNAIIYVERHSQKGIVIGEKGQVIKPSKKEAENELYEMYGILYSLKITIKVEKNWRKNFWMLKKLGYN